MAAKGLQQRRIGVRGRKLRKDWWLPVVLCCSCGAEVGAGGGERGTRGLRVARDAGTGPATQGMCCWPRAHWLRLVALFTSEAQGHRRACKPAVAAHAVSGGASNASLCTCSTDQQLLSIGARPLTHPPNPPHRPAHLQHSAPARGHEHHVGQPRAVRPHQDGRLAQNLEGREEREQEGGMTPGGDRRMGATRTNPRLAIGHTCHKCKCLL